MSANTWYIIGVVGISLGGAALIVAVFLFFRLDIPSVIGDLTGKTVAREIRAMRESNAASGDKLHRPSNVNAQRGTLTAPVDREYAFAMSEAHSSMRLDTGQTDHPQTGVPEKIVTASLPENATEVLPDPEATEVLDDQLTEVLTDILTEYGGTDATEVLHDMPSASPFPDPEATTVLGNTSSVPNQQRKAVTFRILRSVVDVHTDEIAEAQ